MAEIRDFREKKSKTRNSGESYRDKIKRHKQVGLYRILLVAVCVVTLITVVVYKYMTHVYTTYEVTNSLDLTTVHNSVSAPIGNQIMIYSPDGVHSIDAKGETVWDYPFEMQYIMTSKSGDTIALADYNGREVYVFTPKGKIGEIHTTMPIRSFAVAETGRVAVAVTDSKITWIYIYDPDGTRLYEIKTTMGQSGYPASFALSPSGELFAMSCIFVDSGVVKSKVAFYNFGAVGENKSDYYVSGFTFPDTIIPYINYMNNNCIYAAGDDRLVMFNGEQIPNMTNNFIFDEEIKAVYNNDNHVIVSFASDKIEYRNKLLVYTDSSEKYKEVYVDMDYDDIVFGSKYFTIYNENRCQIYNYSGKQKYDGTFDKAVRLMIPVGGEGSFRYIVLTDNSLDTIQLK